MYVDAYFMSAQIIIKSRTRFRRTIRDESHRIQVICVRAIRRHNWK